MRPLCFILLVPACVGEIGAPTEGGSDGSETPVCQTGRSYLGLGGQPLEAERVVLAAGTERMRLKPYGALAAEYTRALGLSTFDASAYATTFGAPPKRWFQEPQASANTVYASFALSYDACTQYAAGNPGLSSAPAPSLAAEVCRDLAHRAWHRTMTDDQLAACTGYAIDQTGADAPAQRWAYACAAVLSAAGFLSY